MNRDGNDCHPFKDSARCWRVTWTESCITAVPKYVSGSWKPSTATSKPFLEEAAATKISPTYCSRRSAWWSQERNSSFFRRQPEMRVSTNSCAEPVFDRTSFRFVLLLLMVGRLPTAGHENATT